MVRVLNIFLLLPNEQFMLFLTTTFTGVNFAHNAQLLVNEYRTKLRDMFNMWVDYMEGGIVTLNNLRAIYGAPAYAYDNHAIV